MVGRKKKQQAAAAAALAAAPIQPLKSPRESSADEEWREATDPKSGRVYYWNTKTRKRQWNDPNALPAAHPHHAPVEVHHGHVEPPRHLVDDEMGHFVHHHGDLPAGPQPPIIGGHEHVHYDQHGAVVAHGAWSGTDHPPPRAVVPPGLAHIVQHGAHYVGDGTSESVYYNPERITPLVVPHLAPPPLQALATDLNDFLGHAVHNEKEAYELRKRLAEIKSMNHEREHQLRGLEMDVSHLRHRLDGKHCSAIAAATDLDDPYGPAIIPGGIGPFNSALSGAGLLHGPNARSAGPQLPAGCHSVAGEVVPAVGPYGEPAGHVAVGDHPNTLVVEGAWGPADIPLAPVSVPQSTIYQMLGDRQFELDMQLGRSMMPAIEVPMHGGHVGVEEILGGFDLQPGEKVVASGNWTPVDAGPPPLAYAPAHFEVEDPMAEAMGRGADTLQRGINGERLPPKVPPYELRSRLPGMNMDRHPMELDRASFRGPSASSSTLANDLGRGPKILPPSGGRSSVMSASDIARALPEPLSFWNGSYIQGNFAGVKGLTTVY